MNHQMTQQTETRDIRHENNTGKRIVVVVFSVIEIALGLRLIFKLLGANSDHGFVRVIYNVTQFVVSIFEGIFSEVSINTATEAVFEPATLIAIVLVALLAILILKLMTPRVSRRVERTEHTGSANQNKPDNNQ